MRLKDKQFDRDASSIVGKVVAGFSMSLDGFIAGSNDDVQPVFAWMFSRLCSIFWRNCSSRLSATPAHRFVCLLGSSHSHRLLGEGIAFHTRFLYTRIAKT